MATIRLWSDFIKRKNSTKQPDNNDSIEVSAKLKEAVSLDSPTFIVNIEYASYNYCQYDDHYYYIDDIVILTNSIIEIHCSKDLLATYKSNIQATSAYVLYHSHNNTEISDSRLSTKTTKTLLSSSGHFDTLGSGTSATAAVILNVVGKNAVASYATTQETAKSIISNFNNWFDNDISDYALDPKGSVFADILNCTSFMCKCLWYAVKQFMATGKASDSIKSALVIPLPVSALSGTNANIQLGNYDTDVNALEIANRIFADGCSVNIPWQATDWRRNSPYHELYLYIPYIGLITLSPSDLVGASTLHVSVIVDVTTGDAIFTVYVEGADQFIGQYNTNLAASFAIGSSNVTPVSKGIAIGSVAAAIATKGTSRIIAATAGFNALENNLSGHPATVSANSGGASLGLTDAVVCYSIYHDTVAEPNSLSATIGTPTNAVMSLSGISGYVQTLAASVNMSGHGTDKDEVNNLLDGGVYIE